MVRTKDMSHYERVSLSWTSRVGGGGKAMAALVFSASQLWYYMVPFYIALFLGYLPKGPWDPANVPLADPLAPLSHALMFGLALGYSMRESRQAVLGYKHVWRPSSFAGQSVSGLLPAPRRVHITEEQTPPAETPAQARPDEAGTDLPVIFCEVLEERDGVPLYGPVTPVASKPAAVQRVCGILLTLFGKLNVFLQGLDGKRLQVMLKRRQATLVAFLALLGKGAEASMKQIKSVLYPDVTKDTLYRVKSDLKHAVNEAARRFATDHPPIDLLRRRESITATYTDLALSDLCTVEWTTDLTRWFELVRLIREDPERASQVPLDEVRQVYRLALCAYGEGLLGQEIEEDLEQEPGYRCWGWAVEPFLNYRAQHLDGLLFAIGREWEASEKAPDPQTQQECLKEGMDLCEHVIAHGSRFYPDEKRCAEALRSLEQIAQGLDDSVTPDMLAQQYADHLAQWQRHEKRWKDRPGS